MIEIERESTRLHYQENSHWNKQRTSWKTDSVVMVIQSLDRTVRGEISQSQEMSLRTVHQQLFWSQLVRKHSKVVGKHKDSTIAK
jgi:primase-polymerase (primpol)-like protein